MSATPSQPSIAPEEQFSVTKGPPWTDAAIEAHYWPGVRHPYLELRSIPAGRPQGSFREAAERARAWHWLVEVMALADVDKVQALDRPSPRHALMRGARPGKCFEPVLLDGYRPAKWLRTHVASKQRYKAAQTAYAHPLWDHLKERSPCFPDGAAWLEAQLTRHGMLQVEPDDDAHAIELGLVAGEQALTADTTSRLDLQVQRFLSLDGLLLLLLLFREAQDLGHRQQAARFRAVLHAVGMEWARLHRYQWEVRDTWRYLLETRFVDWAPRFQPSEAVMTRAEQELVRHHDFIANFSSAKPRTPPGQGKGRIERRWRRQVLMRACRLHFEGVCDLPGFEYRDASSTFEWLTAQRDNIRQHSARATKLLLGFPDMDQTPALEPLVMPAALFAQRQRPSCSGTDRRLFRDHLPFDVIPVRSE
ncbi:hypothetical protein [Pseudoxanthomonas mexicana]|uniref:hypothetical protein n=1 Tax=Pseudoxanthomonas mexicana TaxID=128785 RepID=UPI001389504C|nr:hypothetical protein [Pseudoxanthomonas mexicana]